MNSLHRPGPLVNFMLYQVAWLACVLGAAKGQPLIGVGVALLVVAQHLALSPNAGQELKLILLTGLLGGAWETWLITQDWVRYVGGESAWLAPAWIIALWLAFATTFNVSLRWLQPRPLLAAVLGLVGGPLAWYAGARLGALELPDPSLALSVLGAGWAALMPLLLWLASRLNRQ